MTIEPEADTSRSTLDRLKSNWGSLLFFATLVASLVFFWWLLIYSGGVEIHHG